MKKSMFKNRKTTDNQQIKSIKWHVFLRNFVKKRALKKGLPNDRLPLYYMDRGQKKSIQAISYLANKGQDKTINKIKLVKLLWIADKYHLLKYGRPILKDKYCAMVHGPVQSKMLDLLKKENVDYINENLNKGKTYIKANKPAETLFFSESDLMVLDLVWNHFGNINQWMLRDLTHYYPEWQKFEQAIKNPNMQNSFDMDWEDFFDIPAPTKENMSEFFLSISEGEIDESRETLKNRRKFESA